MASFKDILAERRKSGAGLGSSLKTAFSERAKEKLDPRNYLFTKGGMATALFPKLTGYKAKLGTEKIKRNIASDNISMEPVIVKLDELSMQFKIVTKNSMSLPGMARDMNIMRQNIVKLVKKMKIKPANSADQFFMDANRKESAYEQQFGRRSTSPTAAGKGSTKTDGSSDGFFSGFFSKLLGGGISSFLQDVISGLLKGGLIAAVATGIGKYINDPDFRKNVNEKIDELLKGIFGKDWAENLKTGLITFGAGLLAAKLAMSGIEAAFLGIAGSIPRLIAAALASPAFIAALAATAGVAALAENFRNKEEGLNTAAKKGDIKAMQEEAQRQADQINDEGGTGIGANDILKDRLKKANTPEAKAALKQLEERERDDLEYRKNGPKARSMIIQTVSGKVNNGNRGQKFPISNSPSQVRSDDARASVEEYLGRKISDKEYELLIRATYGEASQHKEEYANVMAVILNRARKTGRSIEQVIYEAGQFEAVTGTKKNKHQPNKNFVNGPNEKFRKMIEDSAGLISGVSKNLDSFSSANPNIYTYGNGKEKIAELKAAGGRQIGGTIFAENRYSKGPIPDLAKNEKNTGKMMDELSTEIINAFRSGSTTNINNTTNNIAKNDSGSGSTILASDGPYNSDLAKMFFARPSIN